MHLRFSKSCSEEARVNLRQLDNLGEANAAEIAHHLEDASMQTSSENGSTSGGMVMNMEDNYDYSLPNVITLQEENDWGVGDDEEDEDLDNDDPARKRLIEFRRYVREVRDDMLPFTKNEEAAIELLDTLRRKKATLDTYDSVMEWHLRQNQELRDHEPYDPRVGSTGYYSRQVMMKRLAHRYNFSPTLFYERPIVLPSTGAKVNLIHYDVRDMVVSLLTDPRLSDDDYLHFNNDPFAPTPDDLGIVGDLNTGRAYRETYKQLITRPGHQILVPIIWYIDGITTGQFDKCHVEQLKFTLGIFNRRARDKACAWRMAGYVPNFSKSNSRGKKLLQETMHSAAHLMPTDEKEGIAHCDDEDCSAHSDDSEDFYKGNKAQDWHRILGALMNSFRKLEQDGMVWDYKYRGKIYKNVELVFFTAFVKCDGDEADKLTGHYRSRGQFVQNICRYCTIPTSKCDAHVMPKGVKTKTVGMIQRMVADDNLTGLQKISQQYIRNAFHDIRFGLHDDTGIHGHCPMELLHQILLGIFKYVQQAFLNQIGPKSKIADEINAIAQLLGRFFARQSERDLPKTNFAKGIFEGKIMGKEYSGVLLLIAAILQTELGQSLLKKRRKHFGTPELQEDWVLMVETLLHWEAFLKLDEMEMRHVVRLRTKHSFLMYIMKKIMKRTTGMGLNIMKFHGILHMVNDMINLGVPNVVDTGAQESHHKETKVAAKLTQKDITVFEKQTAKRVDEFFLLDLAMCEMEGKRMYEYFCLDQQRGALKEEVQDESISDQVTTYGTQIEVYLDEDGEVSWKMPKSTAGASWECAVTEYLYGLQELIDPLGNSKLNIRTEHKRNGQIFRGHPNFKKRGQWNDWAILDWGAHYGKLPAEIWCFVDLSDKPAGFSLKYGDCTIQPGVYAVVESSHYDRKADGSPNCKSEMFVPLIKEVGSVDDDGDILERKFYLADVESIVSPACVIPDVGCHKLRYFEVLARNKWPDLFKTWLMTTHREDAEEMNSEVEEDDSEDGENEEE